MGSMLPYIAYMDPMGIPISGRLSQHMSIICHLTCEQILSEPLANWLFTFFEMASCFMEDPIQVTSSQRKFQYSKI